MTIEQRNITLWLAIAAGIGAVIFFSSYERSWLHPHFFIHNMPRLIPDSLGFKWRDLLLPFTLFEGQEYRPRFLTYYWLLVDHHIRLWSYQYTLIPPTITTAWIVEIFAVFVLYKVVVKLTANDVAGLIAVAVYVSSVGFLSCFGVNFMPGKPMSHVVLICAIHLAMENKLVAMSVLIFFGSLLDETALIIPFAVFAMFPRRDVAVSLAWAMAAFLIVAIVVTPLITLYVFNYRFNFLHTAVHDGGSEFSVMMVCRNVLALFGSGILPLQWADPAETLWPYALSLAGFLVLTWKADKRVWIATAVFLALFSALMSRHSGWAYGFYYGSVFSVFLALIVSTAYQGRTAILALALLMIAMQINNFSVIQERWAKVHDDISNKIYYEGKAQAQRTDYAEISAIYHAWRAGELEPFLAANPPSAGALYLVAELRHLSKLK